METDGQRMARFYSDFEKLKQNREKIPFRTLQTKYARAYNTLVAEVEDGAAWFHRKYMEVLAFPKHPKDTVGNEWLDKRIAAIEADEKKPGGLVDQFRVALIDRMDMKEFEKLVDRSYERRLHEAFGPYWQRHNRWIGEPGHRWIYNDIFKKFWWPRTEGYPDSGCWINSDYSGKDYRYPPQMTEE